MNGKGTGSGTVTYLKVDWDAFVRRHDRDLHRVAMKHCRRLGLPTHLAEDIVQIALILAMAANIEDRGKDSVLRFVYTIIRRRCLDLYRRSKYREIPSSRIRWQGEEKDFLESVARGQDGPSPEELMDLECRKWAVRMGFKYLPAYVSTTHPRAALYIDVLWLTTVRGLSYKQVALELSFEKVERKWTERGRELLRGWVEALCCSSLPSKTLDDNYWKAGYEAGLRFREDCDM